MYYIIANTTNLDQFDPGIKIFKKNDSHIPGYPVSHMTDNTIYRDPLYGDENLVPLWSERFKCKPLASNHYGTPHLLTFYTNKKE